MKWNLYMWNGVNFVFIIEDRSSYIIWNEFGHFPSKTKFVDIFDTLKEAIEYIESKVGKVEAI